MSLSAMFLCAVFSVVAIAGPAKIEPTALDEESPADQWKRAYGKVLTPEYKQVIASVGELVLLADYSLPGGMVDLSGAMSLEIVFEREYQKVKKLSLPARMKFFWVLMLHLPLESTAHFSEEFYETLAMDCGQDMVRSLNQFISKMETWDPKARDLTVAKRGRRDLEMFLQVQK